MDTARQVVSSWLRWNIKKRRRINAEDNTLIAVIDSLNL